MKLTKKHITIGFWLAVVAVFIYWRKQNTTSQVESSGLSSNSMQPLNSFTLPAQTPGMLPNEVTIMPDAPVFPDLVKPATPVLPSEPIFVGDLQLPSKPQVVYPSQPMPTDSGMCLGAVNYTAARQCPEGYMPDWLDRGCCPIKTKTP